MDLSEKIIDKKEELLDEFENLSLEQIAKKIKEIENRDDDVIFKIAYLAARISVLNQRIQALINENSVNDNLIRETSDEPSNIVEKIIKSLPNGLNTRVGERGVQFSGGQVQRIAIARAIYNNPEVLIFDEATASLDSITENDVMDSIYALRGKKTILIIAHNRDILSGCDRIVEMK